MQTPLVSVIIPVYNAEKYINSSIESIIGQTYKNIEIVIINDGSNDNTINIISKIKDKRIVLISNKKNIGIVNSLNKGLEICNGKYIARMDADDISFSTRIEEQVKFMENHNNIGVCGTWIEYFGNQQGIGKTPIEDEDIKAALLFNSSFFHPTVMFRKSFHVQYSNKHPYLEDYYLWYKLKNKTKFHNINKPLLKYRLEGQNITIANKHTQIQRRSLLYREILNDLDIIPSKEEILLHFGLYETTIPPNAKSIIKYYKWLQKLKTQNTKLKLYEIKSLKNIIENNFNKQFHRLIDDSSFNAFVYWFLKKGISLHEFKYFLLTIFSKNKI